MSQSPPASGDQAQAGPAPSPHSPSAAHVQDIRAERASPHHSRARRYHASDRVDFDRINRAASPLLPAIFSISCPTAGAGNESSR